MNLLNIFLEASIQSVKTMSIVILIVVPLVTVFEILIRKKILDKISKKCSHAMGWFELPGEATFPLISGLIMDLAAGVGVLYGYEQKKMLMTRDFNKLCTTLSLACNNRRHCSLRGCGSQFCMDRWFQDDFHDDFGKSFVDGR